MLNLTTEEIKNMSKDALQAELSNRIYAASLLFEQMEHAGLVVCNGHHQAQRIAKFAEEELDRVWKKS